MLFDRIIGQEHIKTHLQNAAKNGRIPHAQLFVGKEGSGTLAMAVAYAQFLLSYFSKAPRASELKVEKLHHPDLHFTFPVCPTLTVKKHPVCNMFLREWKEFVTQQPYGSLFNWLQKIDVEKKQGIIGTDEALEVTKKLQLKSHEGGNKVMIIWMAEKMNVVASNKLLKIIEEPPLKTIFILITENEDQIISTIRSRCQALYFPLLSEQEIASALMLREKASESDALKIAAQSEGNYNKAVRLLHQSTYDIIFEEWFIMWIRSAFKAKGNVSVVKELVAWSETISKKGREVQKQFLEYCLQFFRQAFLLNYKCPELVFLKIRTPKFKLENFAPFVHSKNILLIEKELNVAIVHIERNGNARMVLLDLSMKLTRFLHEKEQPV